MSWTAPRTWSAGAVLTAAQLNTDVRDNLGVLSTALLIPPHQSLSYYSGQFAAERATNVLAANQLYAHPFVVPVTGSYDRIAAMAPAAGGTGNCRMGIYNDNGGVPGSLVLDAGSVAMTGTGATTVTISQSLSGPAKYWLAVAISATPTLWTFNRSQFVGGSGAWEGFSPVCGVQRAFTYAALPNPFGTLGSAGAVPVISLRKS